MRIVELLAQTARLVCEILPFVHQAVELSDGGVGLVRLDSGDTRSERLAPRGPRLGHPAERLAA